ncbi:uncharacterized protein LOC116664033 [Camelus ferus]|uniref:Uncharacterized protein LOC116664033 n=1 Tax=Camelus ferus TaxID=419612 RepID=A0A8B8T3M8_CAMFR|nr:uncharacterized protein LOC116664033 [Camelus ferus]
MNTLPLPLWLQVLGAGPESPGEKQRRALTPIELKPQPSAAPAQPLPVHGRRLQPSQGSPVPARPSDRKRFGGPGPHFSGDLIGTAAPTPQKPSRRADTTLRGYGGGHCPGASSSATSREGPGQGADPRAHSPAGTEEARGERAPRDPACLPAPSARRTEEKTAHILSWCLNTHAVSLTVLQSLGAWLVCSSVLTAPRLCRFRQMGRPFRQVPDAYGAFPVVWGIRKGKAPMAPWLVGSALGPPDDPPRNFRTLATEGSRARAARPAARY